MPTTEREHESPAPADVAALDAVREPSARLQTVELEELVEEALAERPPQVPAVADLYLGLEIDRRYVIESLIAAGGMGLVYRCRHSVLGKRLAIKIIRADVAQMPDGTDRFLLEARAASAIGHEHIVDIADYGALPDGSPYLVMEYLEGTALSALLRGEADLGIPRIAHIACQIAEGLAAAHAAGIVHRDLKPDNVFVLDRKGEDFIKILDFGVARMAQNQKKLTQAGTIVGTPHYMSPEQALGLEVDHRGDIYALGVILYEMLAGRVPFDGDHYVAVLHQHLHAQPPPFESLDPPPSIPAELERIVAKCLAKSPGDRFATMAELAAQLAPFGGALIAPNTPVNDVVTQPPALPQAVEPASATPRAAALQLQLPLDSLEAALPRAKSPSSSPPPVPATARVRTSALPAPTPTRVLPRLTGHFTVHHQRWVTGLSVVVLAIVCAAAAFRLASWRAPIPASPPPLTPPSNPAPALPEVAPSPPPPRIAPALPEAPSNPSPTLVLPPRPSEPTATPAVRSEPAPPSAAGEPTHGNDRATATDRERPAPVAPKRLDGTRPAAPNKPRAKDDFMNPWPAPR